MIMEAILAGLIIALVVFIGASVLWLIAHVIGLAKGDGE